MNLKIRTFLRAALMAGLIYSIFFTAFKDFIDVQEYIFDISFNFFGFGSIMGVMILYGREKEMADIGIHDFTDHACWQFLKQKFTLYTSIDDIKENLLNPESKEFIITPKELNRYSVKIQESMIRNPKSFELTLHQKYNTETDIQFHYPQTGNKFSTDDFDVLITMDEIIKKLKN